MGERVEDEGEKGYCDSSARKTGAPWGHEEHSATPSLKRIMSDEKEGKQTARQQSSSWAEFVKASTSTTSSTTAEATSAEEIQANTRAKGREDAEQLNKGPKREENAGISWYWLGKQARKSPVLSGGKLKCLTCGRPLHGVGVLAQHLKDAHNGVNSAAARTKVVGSKWAENIRKGDARERRKLSAQRESLTSIGDMVTQANNQGGRASQIAPGEVFHKREKEAQLQQRKEAPPGGVTKRRGKQREGQQRRRPKRATSLKKAIWREREQKGLQANEKASVNHSSSEPPAPRPADAPKLNPQAPSFIPGSGRLTGQKNCTYVGDDATFPWYSQQVITKRVNDGVTELCRQMKNFVSESRRKRRYVMGLREATNAVKAGKVRCFILAPNLEHAAPVDEKMKEVLSACSATKTPAVIALTRVKLGKIFHRGKASCCAILDSSGVEKELNEVIASANEGKNRFRELFPRHAAWLDSVFHPDNSSVPHVLRRT